MFNCLHDMTKIIFEILETITKRTSKLKKNPIGGSKMFNILIDTTR